MTGSESDKAEGSAGDSSSESTSNARQNRDKLAEHLANLKAQGGKAEKPGRDAGSSESAGGGNQREIPKPPPQPQGWDAWKQTHGNRIHSISQQDKQRMAEEADYRTLDLQPGASKEEVKRGFNRLAKQYHPDTGGDAEIFQVMLAAYKRLMKE